jgi:hypothetical protein
MLAKYPDGGTLEATDGDLYGAWLRELHPDKLPSE